MSKQSQFHNACYDGDLKLVKKLIEDPEVDLSASDNAILRTAVNNENWDLVNLLLNDYRFKMDETVIHAIKSFKKFYSLIPQYIKDLYL